MRHKCVHAIRTISSKYSIQNLIFSSKKWSLECKQKLDFDISTYNLSRPARHFDECIRRVQPMLDHANKRGPCSSSGSHGRSDGIRDVTRDVARDDDPPVTRDGVSGRSRRWWMTSPYDIDEWTTCRRWQRRMWLTVETIALKRRATCAMLIQATKSRGIVRGDD